ncbi:MAG: TetR/AcrR family transcriptional regulator [Desulfobacterales bacterium]|nr:TetR/AcrR family transcriptional regulator [Desulfobacterales bacterium]
MITRRERIRQMTLDEIKALSWETVSKNGIDKLTVNGLAKQMGMTPPGFYRYYKSRDALIKDLILDAYASFRSALETARDTCPSKQPGIILCRIFTAYRKWAIDNPNMFTLFAGRPVYGFDPSDDQVKREAEKVYTIFIDIYQNAWEMDQVQPPETTVPEEISYLSKGLSSAKNEFGNIPPESIRALINGACLVHGMISMEISGRLEPFIQDKAGFFDHQIRELIHRLGMETE